MSVYETWGELPFPGLEFMPSSLLSEDGVRGLTIFPFVPEVGALWG